MKNRAMKPGELALAFAKATVALPRTAFNAAHDGARWLDTTIKTYPSRAAATSVLFADGFFLINAANAHNWVGVTGSILGIYGASHLVLNGDRTRSPDEPEPQDIRQKNRFEWVKAAFLKRDEYPWEHVALFRISYMSFMLAGALTAPLRGGSISWGGEYICRRRVDRLEHQTLDAGRTAGQHVRPRSQTLSSDYDDGVRL